MQYRFDALPQGMSRNHGRQLRVGQNVTNAKRARRGFNPLATISDTRGGPAVRP
jgi:hypothetical protein